MKIAVPSLGEGGLDAQRSAHFGHADCFTVVNVVDGEVASVDTIANPPHEHGGCMRPVAVLHDATTPTVGEVALLAASGELGAMGAEHACKH